MGNRRLTRPTMWALLVVILALPLLVGFGVGQVELALWALLIAGWVLAYRRWFRPREVLAQ